MCVCVCVAVDHLAKLSRPLIRRYEGGEEVLQGSGGSTVLLAEDFGHSLGHFAVTSPLVS